VNNALDQVDAYAETNRRRFGRSASKKETYLF